MAQGAAEEDGSCWTNDERRTCYVVRHAESRYNAAVKSLSLRAMMGERDHGLSEHGRSQCEALRTLLKELADSGDGDAIAMLEAPWLSSPLRRALATAALVRRGGGTIVALPDGREHCVAPLFARDSEGTPKDHIAVALATELGGVEDTDVDVSNIDGDCWWHVAETASSVRRRLASLLDELYARSEDRPAVFVGHSRALRDMFNHFGLQGGLLSRRCIANCAVVKVALRGDCLLGHNNNNNKDALPRGGGASILEAELLFGSSYK